MKIKFSYLFLLLTLFVSAQENFSKTTKDFNLVGKVQYVKETYQEIESLEKYDKDATTVYLSPQDGKLVSEYWFNKDGFLVESMEQNFKQDKKTILLFWK